MKRVCYFCDKYMGQEGDNHKGEVLHSICDDCYRRLRLEERLPELLWAVAALRKQNGSNEQKLDVLTAT